MIRIQKAFGRGNLGGLAIMAIVVTAFYSGVAYWLEFLTGLNPIVVMAIVFGLAYGGVETYLHFRFSKERFRTAEGTEERSLPQDLFITIPVSFAVCIRLGNYTIFSLAFVVGLIAIWFVAGLGFRD